MTSHPGVSAKIDDQLRNNWLRIRSFRKQKQKTEAKQSNNEQIGDY